MSQYLMNSRVFVLIVGLILGVAFAVIVTIRGDGMDEATAEVMRTLVTSLTAIAGITGVHAAHVHHTRHLYAEPPRPPAVEFSLPVEAQDPEVEDPS
jgi:hypothetical protein